MLFLFMAIRILVLVGHQRRNVKSNLNNVVLPDVREIPVPAVRLHIDEHIVFLGVTQCNQRAKLPQKLGITEASETIPEYIGFVVALTRPNIYNADFVRFKGRNEIEQCDGLQIAGTDLDGVLAGEMRSGVVKLEEHGTGTNARAS